MKRILDLLSNNAWTYAGTVLVLITLSGPTFKQALLVAGVAFVLHTIIYIGLKDENE